MAMSQVALGACDVAGTLPDEAQSGKDTWVLAGLSPRMPYALLEWLRMAHAARSAGFRVLTLRDPRVPQPEWEAATAASKLAGLREVPSLDIETARNCQLLNHSPSMLVTRCGLAHPWPIQGVMPDAAWIHVLNARRVDLERGACS